MIISFLFLLGAQFINYILHTAECQTSKLNYKLALLLQRDDLLCPNECLYTAEHPYFEEDMECCVCLAQAFCVFNSTIIKQLNISFLMDDTHIISNKNGSEADLYSVTLHSGNITTIPKDLCNINKLVSVDFSYNYISNLDTISCIMSLDTLLLKANRVTHLKNNVFSEMHYPRVVDLSYNALKYIEPEFFLNIDGSLIQFDVSNNMLDSIDISNTVRENHDYFCIANFSNNVINKLTNEMGWICDKEIDLGHGGYVDLTRK